MRYLIAAAAACGLLARTMLPALAAAPPSAAPTPPAASVRFALQLTRTDTPAPAGAAAASPAPVVMATPVLTTLDGNTATISVVGAGAADISYNVQLSPTLIPKENSVAILWSLRLAGKTLPGAASVTLTGASRVPLDKEGGITEIALSDPQTGRRSVFRLQATITSGAGGPAAPAAPPSP